MLGMVNEPGSASVDRLIPMRWPCGPLEVERGARRGDLAADEREVLERWSRPEALDLLAGTPVNALVVPWAAGRATDAAHQEALGPLVAAARGRGLSIVGEVEGEAELRVAARAGEAAGLAALAAGSGDAGSGLPVLRMGERGFDGVKPGAFLGVTGNPWPGMKTSAEGAYDAWTGPTGPPWVDSSGWYVRLARALVHPRVTWLWAAPPEDERPPPAAAYEQAVADAAIYGGRWVVSLDSKLRSDLTRGRPEARDTWSRVAGSLSFFEAHRGWAEHRPVGNLAVVSDFRGENELLSLEVVNLLSRRNLFYKVVERDRASEEALDRMDMVLYLDEAPPGAELRRKLLSFVEAGGTLVTPPGWETRGSTAAPAYPGFSLFRRGRGRLAVSREAFVDPDLLVQSVFELTRHAHDPVRVFNPGVSQIHYATSADDRSAVLHVLRHSQRSFETHTSVWFRRPWASARRWVLSGSPEPVEGEARPPGVEFHVPAAPVYFAVEASARRQED